MKLQDTIKLSSSRAIPQIGFGVYKSPASVCVASVQTALQAGYRHVDSAQYYENEAEVGQAIKGSGLPREDVFVTTKTFGSGTSTEEYFEDVKKSVERIGLAYVDLFLIHGPSGGPEKRQKLWKALEQLQEAGLAKSIGVSNYGVKHLQEMMDYAKIEPVLNQIELHPWCQQRDIVEQCRKDKIEIEAYCPIVRNQKADDPTLAKIAKKHGKETTQVLIRWSLQKGFIPLPKSDTPARIKANVDVYDFELDQEDMDSLDAIKEVLHCAPDNTRCA